MHYTCKSKGETCLDLPIVSSGLPFAVVENIYANRFVHTKGFINSLLALITLKEEQLIFVKVLRHLTTNQYWVPGKMFKGTKGLPSKAKHWGAADCLCLCLIVSPSP